MNWYHCDVVRQLFYLSQDTKRLQYKSLNSVIFSFSEELFRGKNIGEKRIELYLRVHQKESHPGHSKVLYIRYYIKYICEGRKWEDNGAKFYQSSPLLFSHFRYLQRLKKCLRREPTLGS